MKIESVTAKVFVVLDERMMTFWISHRDMAEIQVKEYVKRQFPAFSPADKIDVDILDPQHNWLASCSVD